MAKRDTLMLANSPVLATELRQLTGGPATFVPTNSIRASEFAPFDCRPIGAKPHLLYCGRVTAEKGIRELIEALALPAAQNYELEIVGPAISQEQASFVALAHQLGVSSRVTWHGPVSYGHALFRFFQRADIFVLPSYHEGFPHVIWEAAANCCPVIATRVGGIPGLWTHDTHGMLIAPRSAEEIVRAVNRLQADSDLHEKIVKNAYLHAQEYDVEACAERLVEVLIETWN
ncbi:MAG: glycosyltransferase family 4 protein [Anaerolineae bacterium]|nr:glycosyltransferase family 4 protein [Anaerolineae bacterium]